jgi:hypothetical protein
MSSPYASIYKSIVRSVIDAIEELNADGSFGVVSYHNFEERSKEKDMPAHTLLGTDGFSFDENSGLWMIRLALAVSTYRDYNLLNEVDLIEFLHERFGEQKKVSLRDPATGDIYSELRVSQFRVMPMGQSEYRNYRVIGLELQRTSSS